MYKRIFLSSLIIILSGCATNRDASKAGGVTRQGGGIYTVSELSMGCFFGCDLTQAAVNQCRINGNKKLVLLGSSLEVGVLGNKYPQLIFRCD